MAKQLLFILRQSPDWHALANDFKLGREIDPSRFRPPVHIPGFPGNIVQLVDLWNTTMGVDFFSVRSRLKEMCEDSLAQIPGARRMSYLDVERVGPEIGKSVVFYHDDDDWFAPDIVDTLEEVLPETYDVCVFPLARISTDTATVHRQVGIPPKILIGKARPFSHRYQSNNYGINGRICDQETLLGMKDHVQASEFANSHGLRDVYIDRFISATAKTPCSAQAVAMIFRDPSRAKDHVRMYVDALKVLQIPETLPWISSRIGKLVELFSEALEQRPHGAAVAAVPAADPPAVREFRPQARPVPGPAHPVAAARPVPGAGRPAVPRPAQPAAIRPVAPAGPRPVPPVRSPHVGIRYLEFIKFLAGQIAPSSYFEVGTRMGGSLGQIDCDAVCVDPAFAVSTNVIKKRRRCFFFQMTSDDFFATYDLKQFYPEGVDLAFLDGMHRFEFLLRDFINTEKFCRPDSVIFLHDSLPHTKNITNRVQTPGAWAGDVWKVLPILKRYRPDLKITAFDCPPTGLVACTNLDPNSNVLQDVYDQVVAEFLDVVELPEDLQTMFPRGDSKYLFEHPEALEGIVPVAAASIRAAE